MCVAATAVASATSAFAFTLATQTVPVEPVESEPPPASQTPESPPPDSQPATTEDADVPVATEVADTMPGDIATDVDDTDVSAWWWVAGVAVAVAAVGGVVVAVRLRDNTERWAQRASLLCDSARAMSVTLSTRLTDPSPWSIPTRYTEQQQRCTAYIGELTSSVPDAQAGAAVVGVARGIEQLHAAVTTVAVGERIDVARGLLHPHLDQLAASLTVLEELATALAMHAALPSSRAAN